MINWASLVGSMDVKKEDITFKGGGRKLTGTAEDLAAYGLDPEIEYSELGNFLSDINFEGGEISTEVEFSKIDKDSACEIIVYYDLNTGAMVTVGLGGTSENMYTIRYFDGRTWKFVKQSGTRAGLASKVKYNLHVKVAGSRLNLSVNGVGVLSAELAFNVPSSQIGIWARGYNDIHIRKFKAKTSKPTAFIIMPLSSPYLEINEQIIEPICNEFNLQADNALKKYGPGLIISDIQKQIAEAKVIISDITTLNPNVFYEVGYAMALNKSPILLAEEATILPFDIKSFRAILYKNTVVGKDSLMESLRKHVSEVINLKPL
jgi:hypothetical protein